MAVSPYPRDINHPSGFKTTTVYSSDEERAVHEENAAWRAQHREAELASAEGRPVQGPQDDGAQDEAEAPAPIAPRKRGRPPSSAPAITAAPTDSFEA